MLYMHAQLQMAVSVVHHWINEKKKPTLTLNKTV